jgi:hypothetical protein
MRSALVLLVLAAAALPAQESKHPGRTGPRKLLAITEEVALARSAAPASISDSAAVWVFSDSGYVLASRGDGSGACYVSRSWPNSIEPHCFDAEGAATIMKIHMREVELLHRGATPSQADAEIGAAIMNGTLSLPRRPVMSWMMSSEQSLISDTGQAAGRWRPHVMIYHAYLPAMARFDITAGMVTGAGTPTSSIMIVVPEFVTVRRTGTSFK